VRVCAGPSARRIVATHGHNGYAPGATVTVNGSVSGMASGSQATIRPVGAVSVAIGWSSITYSTLSCANRAPRTSSAVSSG
jgi:hypothetical protein